MVSELEPRIDTGLEQEHCVDQEWEPVAFSFKTSGPYS